jgi:DNA polymerase
MKEEISELLVKKKTIPTEEVETYDILNCGPNRRFYINSCIAHNCGYGMGSVKFQATCESYGMNVGYPLAKRAVDTYRNKYRKVVKFWEEAEETAKLAIRIPNRKIPCGKVVWKRIGANLYCKLPSGRFITYNNVSLVKEKDRTEIRYYTENSQIKKWEEHKTWGGKLVENICQAIARDILAEAMLRLEEKLYPIILTVHDEILSEVIKSFGSVKEFVSIMEIIPEWATGCRIAVEAWEGDRYKK